MLQIRVLGQFDVRVDGKRVLIPSRPAQSLLAYLALTAGTPHRREKLAGILWPDFPDDNARKNLRHELWRLRKAISTQQPTTVDYLLAEEFTIAFNRESEYWLDAAQMERPELDLGSLLSNLSLYQGELLPGFYEDWIVLERERIQRMFDTKMEQLLGQLIAAERWTAVQEQAERWLSLGHTLEPAYRALMLAYGASGDMAKVSSIYQRCMAELNEQFGIEPSAETRALYDGLLKGAPVPPRATQSSGTVTFLFTDIEESTNLLDKLGDQYATVLAEHHAILRAAIQKWNGREVDTQGDAFLVTFARALDAVQCVAGAQRALASHTWLHNQPLRVRMGLHTGEPLIASTGYVGMDVHRAARIGDAAHGGQILLSQTTRELVWHDLPKGVTIRDLGEHRLKDLKFPTPIYQLVIEGLSHDFPPLRTKFTGAEAPTPGEPPFKGLQYFDETDSDLFFGRELLTAKLVNRLRETEFLSVVIGASGSGKSSLVRAGLIPALKKGQMLPDGTQPPEGSAGWRVHVITPTAHPLQALATELTRESESVTAAATLMDDLMQDPRSLTLFLARENPKQHTLLVLDQFEELFTLCRDEFEREAFIDNLLTTLNQGQGNITLILTLRADFYAHLAHYPELREAVARQQEYIGPMTTEELRRAMEEPAKRGHWAFEPGLVDLILRDVGDEPGALPLLSHALLETWKRRAGHTLTLKGYADAGGVRGAIAHTAESVYQKLSSEEQAIARNIFLRLTELGEGTEDTRRRASFDELILHAENASEARSVLNSLAEARLVTLGEDSAEVAHEALIREWPTLREWLNQDRESLRLHRHLTEAAHEWEFLERDTGALYRGSHLAQAREWAALQPNSLNAGERAFLEASNEWEQHEAREREDQQRRELEAAQKLAETEKARAEEQVTSVKRLRQRGVFLASALVLALVAAIFASVFADRNSTLATSNAEIASTAQANEAIAIQERQTAQQQALISSVRELSNAANLNLQIDPERSILLALQAVNKTYAVDHTVLPQAEDALHRAVQASRVELTFRGHMDAVWSAVFSPDGTQIATASWDRTAKIWDATTGKELLTIKASTGFLWYAAFSPNGKLLATAGEESIARIWDATTGENLLSLLGHTQQIYHIEFSPDGNRVATISTDGTAKIWDVRTGKELLTLIDEEGSEPQWFAFSPDGSRIAIAYITGLSEGQITIWDAVTGQKILTLPRQNSFMRSVAFSPDGSRLATTSFDGTANIWDATTGELLLTLVGHEDWVSSIAFSPDGSRIATSSWDGTAIVWDAVTGKELFLLASHTSTVRQAVFSPDGTRLATASFDGSAKLWDAVSGKEMLSLSGHTGSVYSVAFSPDGKTIATASGDKTAKLWDALTGKELLTLHAPDGLTSVAFSPDGSQLAVASRDGTNRIYLLKIEDLIALAKQRVTRSLTTEECQQYLHVAECPAEP